MGLTELQQEAMSRPVFRADEVEACAAVRTLESRHQIKMTFRVEPDYRWCVAVSKLRRFNPQPLSGMSSGAKRELVAVAMRALLGCGDPQQQEVSWGKYAVVLRRKATAIEVDMYKVQARADAEGDHAEDK